MTNTRIATILTLVAMATTLTAQTIRIAPPVQAPVSEADVLVLHEFNKVTGKLAGTMPARYVTEMRQRLSSLLDVAVVEGFVTTPLYLTRETARGAAAGRATSSGPDLGGAEATFNAMSVLRAQPAVGRDFAEADVAASRRLVLLTSGCWQRMFGRNAAAIGTVLWSGHQGAEPQPYEIVGVLPSGLMTENPEIDPRIDALVLAETRFQAPPPDERWFAPIVRLKPGVSLDAAQRGIDTALIAARRGLGTDDPPDHDWGARLDTMRRGPLGK